MKLTHLEADSSAWQKTRQHAEQRLEKHRRSLEGDKDAIATATLRGQIKELRLLLALAQPGPQSEQLAD